MSYNVDNNVCLIGKQKYYFCAVTFVPLENGLLDIWHLIGVVDETIVPIIG